MTRRGRTPRQTVTALPGQSRIASLRFSEGVRGSSEAPALRKKADRSTGKDGRQAASLVRSVMLKGTHMDVIDNGYLAPPQYDPGLIPDLMRRIWDLEDTLASVAHEAHYQAYRAWIAEQEHTAATNRLQSLTARQQAQRERTDTQAPEAEQHTK